MKIKGVISTKKYPGLHAVYIPYVVVERKTFFGLISVKEILYLKMCAMFDNDMNIVTWYILSEVNQGEAFPTYREAHQALESAFEDYGMSLLIKNLVKK